MRRCLLISLAALSLLAEESKPAPTVERLQAELKVVSDERDSLKAQLAHVQAMGAFELKMCNAAVQAAREFVTGPPKQASRPTQQQRTIQP